jgi:hypothetical protein
LSSQLTCIQKPESNTKGNQIPSDSLSLRCFVQRRLFALGKEFSIAFVIALSSSLPNSMLSWSLSSMLSIQCYLKGNICPPSSLVYKNQRVTRKETKYHQIFAGSMLLHNDAWYQLKVSSTLISPSSPKIADIILLLYVVFTPTRFCK